MAGRATLVQSVTSAIPSYAMQTQMLPIAVCDTIDRLHRNFIWNDWPEAPKVHLLNWDTICLPKKAGGLGIKKMKEYNVSLVAKLGWKLLIREDTPWVNILTHKYIRTRDLLDNQQLKGSHTWRSIVKGLDGLKGGLIWKIGNGESVKFWLDSWVGSAPLRDSLINPSFLIDHELRVADVIDENRCWNLSHLSTAIPEDVVAEIQSKPIPLNSICIDKLSWKNSTDGIFSVKTAYSLLISCGIGADLDWNWLWKFKCAQKLKVFLWLVAHNRLLTNELRMHRKITNTPHCFRCMDPIEDCLHILRVCPLAQQVWASCPEVSQRPSFFSIDLKTWIKSNICATNVNAGHLAWSYDFIAIIWHLWKARNIWIFEGIQWSVWDVLHHSNRLAMDLKRCFIVPSSATFKMPRIISWQRPPDGFFKLNSDGSSRGNPGSSGVGGVLRDANGNWVCGFAGLIGICSSIHAELWGIRVGLELAWNRSIRRLVAETDSALAIQLITDAQTDRHPLGVLIDDCRDLLAQNWECTLVHTLREGNSCADYMASISHEIGLSIQLFEDPPQGVCHLLLADSVGVASLRL